jgi:hypothetical protein
VSSVTVLPVALASLDAAMRSRRPVLVSYHGRTRLICPHALGWRAGRAMVLGYQTGGETSSGTLDPDPHKRWRLLYLDQIDQIDEGDAANTWGTADNYNPARPFPVIDEVFRAIGYEPTTDE